MEFIWFWVGGVVVVLWLLLAADAIARKTPWREVALTAAIIAAPFAGFGALGHLAVYWLTQNGLGWLLALIGFFCMVFALCCALVGGVLRLLYRS
ncbi:MAG: hypothetical protein OXU62_02620 [Gammaproteobacteria bacterium]|nr:hypothetical protein [Gammaproteobacteria bacterium]